MKPISPEELNSIKPVIPDRVIEVINNLIKKRYYKNIRFFEIKERVIISEIVNQFGDNFDRNEIFENHWLDFEELYEQYGWKITYVKLLYCNNFELYFE